MRRFITWITGRRSDERGAIVVISALALPLLLAASALAFDVGREVDTNRSTQALADAVALDAAEFIDGTTATASDPYVQINGATYELAQVIQYQAAESAVRNNVSSPGDDIVVLGSCSSSSQCPTFTPIEDCPLTTVLPAVAPTGQAGVGGECYQATGADPATV
ncbi:MAG TPA: pilus assembly protein TadG-related protein, partial [Acidimicrobiales bacterium]|nr:pilus assembly protein TadG-related protein [Acidimicrobiales bacterium]